jgi:ATP-dependent Lon protease
LKKELDLGKLQSKISKQIDSRLQKNQREFFLREQLKEIKQELGLAKDEKGAEIEKIIARGAKLNFSEDAKKIFDEEVEKLQLLEPHSPDFSVVRNYLDWIVSLPWGIYSDEKIIMQEAEKILKEEHYGLEDIKERILEFIAVLKLAKKDTSSILCFVGPPGVGKTSVGKSIAKALKRPFYRFSVGGMRDESEIKGHRRTYIGAMPGKFIQTLKQTKVANPVIMLDEIDKLGKSYQGDPASALLEVFDSEQNHLFLDHYLDIPFDLSKVFFITTANQLDTIPSALLDRMEVMRLAGYITKEKLEIAKKYIIPKQRKNHGLKSTQLQFTDSAIYKIIEGYARESGVRSLESLIKKICRKVAYEIASGSITKMSINHQRVEKYLKLPVFTDEGIFDKSQIGLVNGLAWTSLGGDVLSIEAIPNEGKKGFKQTGQLGKVMVESSEIAYSYVFSNAKKYKGDTQFFEKNFIHLHVPAGATPKDGPSAGITMASSLISLMLKKSVDTKIGMTGELTLNGNVLPIGGLKEKVIAAKRNNLKQVIIPYSNKKDYEELPKHLKDLKIHFVKNYKEVFQILF